MPGIPGEVVELLVGNGDQLALVDVIGVKRKINIGLLEDDPVVPGDWVLIHVGFAMSKVDEREAAEALRMLELMGQAFTDELQARGRVGDRMTSCDATGGCITCGDVAVPLTVLAVSGVDARCRDDAGRGDRGRRPGRRRRTGGPGAGAREGGTGPAGGGSMRFVDEFRDADLARRWRPRSPRCASRAGTTSSWRCAAGTPTPSTATASGPPAGLRRAGARPGLPGLRDPDGPGRRRHRDRRAARGDHDLLRRHDAGARQRRLVPRRERGRAPTSGWSTRRWTRCGSPGRTRTGRSSSTPSASRPPRRRPR